MDMREVRSEIYTHTGKARKYLQRRKKEYCCNTQKKTVPKALFLY